MGEQVLLGAVLLRAALDAVRGKDPGFIDTSFTTHHWHAARRWFGLHRTTPNLKTGKDDYFTFRDCCEGLGLCPHRVYKRLKQLDKESAGKINCGTYVSVLRRIILDTDQAPSFLLSKHG